MANKEPITLTLSPSLVRKIDRLAKALGQSRSKFCEDLLREGIEDASLGVEALTNPEVQKAFVGLLKNRDVLRSLAKAFGSELSDSQLELFAGTFQRLAERGGK